MAYKKLEKSFQGMVPYIKKTRGHGGTKSLIYPRKEMKKYIIAQSFQSHTFLPGNS